MARSLRRAGKEPAGEFTDSASGSKITIRSDGRSTWQAEYPIAYVIGSGKHAAGYLVQIGDHLFQSPLCYYTNRRAYGLAPGYEHLAEPDFTRPISDECLLCHSGRPLHIPETVNRYAPSVFAEEAISCERCHGPVDEHLRRPVPGAIVNPAELAPAARDSVCEQCHLAGLTRVPNPGKGFADFRPGQRLEEVFTVYVTGGARPFRVISHAEQLALSACARNSTGTLWCGTCHDPHPQTPASTQTYDSRCQTCHEGRLPASHTERANCISCHMTRRQAQDGGHTVFTDHRITRRPQPNETSARTDELKAWRAPDAALEQRNLALAYVNTGIAAGAPAQIVRGYRMLTEVQKADPNDVAVLRAIGRVLLLGKNPREAQFAFDRVLQLEPNNATSEEDVGVSYLESGDAEKAAQHLERALELDPLLLTAATALESAYRKQGRNEDAATVAGRIGRAMHQSRPR